MSVLLSADALDARLHDFLGADGVRTGVVVDGAWLPGEGDALDCLNPATEQVLARPHGASLAQVRAAVAAARRSFDDGRWATFVPADRATLLRRVADSIERHGDVLALAGQFECGTPVRFSRATHVDLPAEFYAWWADMAVKGPRGGREESLGLWRTPVNGVSVLLREPIGVVAAMTAYNAPLAINAFKVGGALAAGCTVVLLPSPRAVLQNAAFMRVIEDADLPPGVVNAIAGFADVGAALTEAPGVDMVSFTGSAAVGKQVMAQAARGLKKVVLELGGKSPNIVLPGQDLDRVVEPAVQRFVRGAGQACGATTRILVSRDQYAEFVDRAGRYLATVVVGDPADPATDVGPVIRGEHRDNVLAYVQRACAAGAVVEAQAPPASASTGYYVTPMLLGNVGGDAEVCQEELFGPVAVLMPYDDVDEAVAIANDTRYGLNANIWGHVADALPLVRRIKSGTVTVNGGVGERPDAPWPGWGESGVGTDRGVDGFQEFHTVRHVAVSL
jgi:aldehyde dehydrogenase (NAD+)